MTKSVSPDSPPTGAPAALRRHAPWLVIVLAALLAHGGCLRSTFYLDDFVQLIDTDLVDHGQWYNAGLRRLTYVTYVLTYRLAGMSAPAFHLGNLLLHAAVAVIVSRFASDFLVHAAELPPGRARRLGWWAGMFFAVHPLCSEVPNYARARDIEMVSLFALLAAWAALRWRVRGGRDWRWAGAGLAAVFAAAFSKEVGVVVASGFAVLTWFGTRGLPGTDWRAWPWRRIAWIAGGSIAAAMVAAYTTSFGRLLDVMTRSLLHDSRLGWHVLTQARVFWMYAWRVVLPVRLCSDHQIAWTASLADGAAWVALTTMLAVIAATARACMHRRWRAAGVLAAMALLADLHRLANVSSELMVEYRMYPAMVPLCILLAWGLDALRRPEPGRAGRVALATLVGAWTLLSAWRTLDWRSSETLSANIIAQYPFQARARAEVQEADIRAGRWQAVVDRQKDIRTALDGALAFNRAQPLRRYDTDLLTLTRVASEGNYALGLAHLGRHREALAHCAWLMDRLRSNGTAHPIYWATFYYARGRVYDATGQQDEAVLDLREGVDQFPFDFIRRELRRVEAEAPAPAR